MSGNYILPFNDQFLSLTGGTVSGNTYFQFNLSATTFYSGNTELGSLFSGGTGTGVGVTGITYVPNTGILSLDRIDGVTLTAGTWSYFIDGDYDSGTGVLSLYNNTGGTLNISGFNVSTLSGNCFILRTENILETTGTTQSLLATITGFTGGTYIVESYITAYKANNEYGTWKRTLGVLITGDTPNIVYESDDLDRVSSGFDGGAIFYSPNTGKTINILVSGTTIQDCEWISYYEIIDEGSFCSNGTNGTSGSSGINGSSGVNGTSGSAGSAGSAGSSGVNGTSGSAGSSGTNGSSGSSGVNGTSGSAGSSGTSGFGYLSEILTSSILYTFTGGTNSITVNTLSATTVNLNSSPSINDFYNVKIRHDASLYPVIISGNSKNIDGYSAITASITNSSYLFLYNGLEYIII